MSKKLAAALLAAAFLSIPLAFDLSNSGVGIATAAAAEKTAKEKTAKEKTKKKAEKKKAEEKMKAAPSK